MSPVFEILDQAAFDADVTDRGGFWCFIKGKGAWLARLFYDVEEVL